MKMNVLIEELGDRSANAKLSNIAMKLAESGMSEAQLKSVVDAANNEMVVHLNRFLGLMAAAELKNWPKQIDGLDLADWFKLEAAKSDQAFISGQIVGDIVEYL